MHERWIKLGRVVATFTAAGWVAGVLLIAIDSRSTLLDALQHSASVRATISTGLAGLLWGPLVAWTGIRWYLGIIVGLLVTATSIYLYFFLWPHDWQADRFAAWKTLGLFISAYWEYLLPLSIVFGSASAELARRPVQPPRWQQLADTPSSEEEAG